LRSVGIAEFEVLTSAHAASDFRATPDAEQGADAKEIRHFVWDSVAPRREKANSATEALELVRHLMKLRRPGVTIEDEWGDPVSFFQLKDMAAAESQREPVSPLRR
jgi:hypothetical protein